jgi:hypothetical protein
MANWHSSHWHSADCLKKSSHIGAVDRTFAWIKVSAEEGCEGCRVAQCAVEKYCERWFAPEHRKVLTTPFTDLWSEHDIRIVISGNSGDLKVEIQGGWYNRRLSGTLEIFTEPGKFSTQWVGSYNPFHALHTQRRGVLIYFRRKPFSLAIRRDSKNSLQVICLKRVSVNYQGLD